MKTAFFSKPTSTREHSTEIAEQPKLLTDRAMAIFEWEQVRHNFYAANLVKALRRVPEQEFNKADFLNKVKKVYKCVVNSKTTLVKTKKSCSS